MGLSLSIPMAILGDFVFKGELKGILYWFGAVLVLTGFVIGQSVDQSLSDGVPC
jgi:drug/metabolite transporter (DMT)-like permease